MAAMRLTSGGIRAIFGGSAGKALAKDEREIPMTILQDTTTPSHDDILAELALLREENEKLRAKKAEKGITMKVGEKGGLSVYGLGRFPVSLYRGQWERLLAHKDDILAFIKANEAKLSVKA